MSEQDLIGAALAQAPFSALLFRPDEALTLVWRNAAHEEMTDTQGFDVAGLGMFEAFPPNDAENGAAAMQAIRNAVDEIVAKRSPVEIGPYRYDLKDADGRFTEYHWRINMSPLTQDDRIVAILQVAQDVTNEVLVAKMGESLRRAAASTAGISHFSYDPQTDLFARTAAVDEMFGFAPGEAGDLAAPFFERVHPEDLPGVMAEVDRVFSLPRGEIAAFDYRVPRDDGTERFLRIRAEVAVDPGDRREKLVGTFVDLTDVENDRRQLKRELDLRKALVEEANHRIKNSLAIALAMLRLEKRVIAEADPEGSQTAISALNALESRIGAVSGAHGLMQLDGHQTQVSTHHLLRELVRQMRTTAGLPEDAVRLALTGPDQQLGSDTGTILGLVMSELLTNAVKYGMTATGGADIEVSAGVTPLGLEITVRNRIETEDPIEMIPSTQLGSQIVQQLASDFGAEIDVSAQGGSYLASLRLPIADAEPAVVSAA